jgi:hypothetical protein
MDMTEKGTELLGRLNPKLAAVAEKYVLSRPAVRARLEKRYDAKFHAVLATLRQKLEAPIPPKRQIGFLLHPNFARHALPSAPPHSSK